MASFCLRNCRRKKGPMKQSDRPTLVQFKYLDIVLYTLKQAANVTLIIPRSNCSLLFLLAYCKNQQNLKLKSSSSIKITNYSISYSENKFPNGKQFPTLMFTKRFCPIVSIYNKDWGFFTFLYLLLCFFAHEHFCLEIGGTTQCVLFWMDRDFKRNASLMETAFKGSIRLACEYIRTNYVQFVVQLYCDIEKRVSGLLFRSKHRQSLLEAKVPVIFFFFLLFTILRHFKKTPWSEQLVFWVLVCNKKTFLTLVGKSIF